MTRLTSFATQLPQPFWSVMMLLSWPQSLVSMVWVRPKEYADSVVSLRPGLEISRDKLLNDLVDIQFERNDIDFQREDFVFVGMW